MVDPFVYIEGIGRCVEGEYVGRFGRRFIGI